MSGTDFGPLLLRDDRIATATEVVDRGLLTEGNQIVALAVDGPPEGAAVLTIAEVAVVSRTQTLDYAVGAH